MLQGTKYLKNIPILSNIGIIRSYANVESAINN
jgi:hypothetical protein